MKTCVGCKFAKWKRNASGRLHPSGDGWCGCEVKMPVLPASKRWLGGGPKPLGGYINRREELNDHCPRYEREVTHVCDPLP